MPTRAWLAGTAGAIAEASGAERSTSMPVGTANDKIPLGGGNGATFGSASATAGGSTNNNTTLAQTADQDMAICRLVVTHVTLAAQTIAAQNWTVQFSGYVSGSQVTARWVPVIYVWRPSTDTKVGTIYDAHTTTLGTALTTSVAQQQITVAGSSVAVQAGDMIVVEYWAHITQSMATSYGLPIALANLWVDIPDAVTLLVPDRPPVAGNMVSAVATSSTTIDVTLVQNTDAGSPVATAQVERSTDQTNWTVVTTYGNVVGSSNWTITDNTGLSAGVTYYYRNKLSNSSGTDYSNNTVSATTPVTQTAGVVLNARGNLSAGPTRTTPGALALNAPGNLQADSYTFDPIESRGAVPGSRTNRPGFVRVGAGKIGFTVIQLGSVQLNAAGSLSTAATPTRVAAATLNAPGSLSSAGTRTTTGSDGFLAPGALLTSAPVRTTTGGDTLDAPGNLSVTGTPTRMAAANLTAAGALSTTGTPTRMASANLNAPAVMSSASTPGRTAGAALNAPAAMGASTTNRTTFGAEELNAPGFILAKTETQASADLLARGNLAVGSQVTFVVGSVLNAPGALSSAPIRVTFGAEALDAPAALTAGPGRIAVVAATLIGRGNLSVTANTGQFGSESLDAPGFLQAGGTPTRMAAALLNAAGRLQALLTGRETFGAETLDAPAALTVQSPRLTMAVGAALGAPANLTSFTGVGGESQLIAPALLSVGTTLRTSFASAALNAAGVLSTAAARVTTALANIVAPGALSATPIRVTFGAEDMLAPGSLVVGSQGILAVGSVLNAPGRLQGLSTGRVTFGASLLNAAGVLVTQPLLQRFGGANLLAPGALASNPIKTRFGAVNLLAAGNLSSSPVRLVAGAVNLLGPGNLLAGAWKLLIQVRSPISGQLVPAIVRVRSKGTDPFMLPRIITRDTGTGAWKTAQPGTDNRLLEIGAGPVYSDGGGFASTWEWRPFPDEYGPTSKSVFRMTKTPGRPAGWGSYIAAGLRGATIQAGRKIRVRWRMRSNYTFVLAPQIVNDPAQRQVAATQNATVTPEWQQFIQTYDTYEEWTSLDVAATGHAQRWRLGVPATDGLFIDLSDVMLEVIG